MPELPEVETVRKCLIDRVVGKNVSDISIYYNGICFDKDKVIGKNIVDVKRRGKYLIFCLSYGYLVSHLRMEGKYYIDRIDCPLRKHDLVMFSFSDNNSLRYNDTRKFGKMWYIDNYLELDEIKKLGLEPFDEGFDNDYLYSKLKSKNIAIKTLLLDQSIICGIGNIYADEILFLSGIDPIMKGSAIDRGMIDKIISNSKMVLSRAIEMGGSTIRSYTSMEGAGHFQNNLLVHNREGESCKKCNNVIKKIKVNGRGTYFCPYCQGGSYGLQL